MKITTANVKNPAYAGQHELFVGTHTGSFKSKQTPTAYFVRLCTQILTNHLLAPPAAEIDVTADDPHAQTNLQAIAALDKHSRITSLNFGADQSELLIGRANKFAKVFDASAGEFTGSIEMLDAPIVGLARYEGRLIAGIGTGRIQILAETPAVLETGDHMSLMCQCADNRKLVATGGKERQNNVKLWDLETQQRVFHSKNVANDFLQLEVPVWDSHLSFAGEHQLLTCSRFGYIRRYDVRAQRRPVVEYRNAKEQIAYNCLATHGDLLFAGTSTGVIRAFDQRRLKVVAHTYKGFTGSISDVGVDETGRFLYSASLDRYVRVHCAESTALMYQCYVKSKATKVLMRTKPAEEEAAAGAVGANDSDCVFLGVEEDDDEEEAQADDAEPEAGSDPEFDQLFDNMKTIR